MGAMCPLQIWTLPQGTYRLSKTNMRVKGLNRNVRCHAPPLPRFAPTEPPCLEITYFQKRMHRQIATGYGLDGPGIESRLGARFFADVHQTGPEAHPASCAMGTGSFPGVKRPGRGADHPPPSSAEVKKE
jgi:hypothetical protein